MGIAILSLGGYPHEQIAATSRLALPIAFEKQGTESVFLCRHHFDRCTATQVRWDATKMRKDVMVYYNDQIMDNLIRAKYKLPFVHVDITLLTSAGGSQISGTIGAGESRTVRILRSRWQGRLEQSLTL